VKKIVFVLTQSLDSPSGLGRYGPMARALVKCGYRVQVLALHPDWDNLKQRRLVEDGVDITYVAPMHVRKAGSHKSYYSPPRLLWLSLRAILALALALYRSDAEIIQLGKAQPYNVIAVRLAGRGRPVVVDCDDYEAETNRFGGRWQRAIVRHFEDSIVRFATALTVNTCFTETRYTELGYPPGRIVYIPNGVERERFTGLSDLTALQARLGLSAGKPLIVYVGSLGLTSHPVDLLLEAMRKIVPVLPDARLLLVGGGEDFGTLQELAQSLGIAERTIFTGRVSPEDIPAYMALATLTVDPVHDDLVARARSPLKVVESLAAGTPVVTADVGDRHIMLEGGKLGALVPAGDSTALAQTIISLLNDDARRAAMKAAAGTTREAWYWDNLVERLLQVYSTVEAKEAANEKGRPSA
jgi:glycosyltransferase involved in cell wall biosynthesis